MPALNRVQLIGRLGKDPEGKFTPTGKKLSYFSIAISNHWKSKEGEAKESTEWVNIEAWGRLGEVCQEYLKKAPRVTDNPSALRPHSVTGALTNCQRGRLPQPYMISSMK